VFRPACVDDHAVQAAGLGEDLIHSFCGAVFVRDVRFDCMKLRRELLLNGLEIVGWIFDVEGKDVCGAVIEAGVDDAETDSYYKGKSGR
jgi:hypothetical protein